MSQGSGSTTSSEKFGEQKEGKNDSAADHFRKSPDIFDDNLSEPEESSVQFIAKFEKRTDRSSSMADINKIEDDELMKKISLWRQRSSFYEARPAETITKCPEQRTGLKRKAEEFVENSESLLNDSENEQHGVDWKIRQAWREQDNYENIEESDNQQEQDEDHAQENSQAFTSKDSPSIVEEDTSYHLISDLIGEGITDKDVAKLFAAGYSTIEAFLFEPKKTLIRIPGLSEQKIDRMLQYGTRQTGLTGFTTATKVLARRLEILSITTGCKALDRILGRGIETGSVTEIYGLSGSGKTQLCHTLALTCQLPVERGGADGKCLYVDSEGNFRSERLVSISTRFKLDTETALDNVGYARSYNSDHQTKLMIQAAALMTESRYALLIVDSATALYRTDYDGRSELSARQIHLCRFLRTLLRLADEFGVAVVITNQMRANMDGSALLGEANVPIGGYIMSHATSTRLSLRRSRGSTRICRITASASQPETEVVLDITAGGIDDVYE